MIPGIGEAAAAMVPAAQDAIGAPISTIFGIGQLIAGSLEDNPYIAPEDPGQRKFLDEIERKRKAIDTGANYVAASRELDQAQAASNSAILGAAGGGTGQALNAILKSQRATGAGMNTVLSAGENDQKYFTSLAQSAIDRMASRKLDIDAYRYQEQAAKKAQLTQEGMGNLMSGLAAGGGAASEMALQTAGKQPSQDKISTPLPAGTMTDTPTGGGMMMETTSVQPAIQMPATIQEENLTEFKGNSGAMPWF